MLILEDDNDKDGFTNRSERILHTNPIDSRSRFRISISKGVNTNPVLKYSPHSSEAIFTVKRSSDIKELRSNWLVLEGLSFQGDFTGKTVELPQTEEPTMFYIIEIAEPET